MACEPEALVGELRRILAPESWPVPLETLPQGTVLVGGAVRDALLGRLVPRPDLDLVVQGDAVELARNLARQLMTYALGRSLGIADQPALDQLDAQWREQGYRLRELVQRVTASDLMQQP